MNHSYRKAKRLREVLLDGRWIANTNYKDQVEKADYQQAVKKVNGLNSIAALTFHINYYLGGLLSAFETGKLEIRDKFSFDLPSIESEEAWQNLVAEFLSNAMAFIKEIEAMTDEDLELPFIDEKYGTFARNIDGVIEHAYYHLGQIVIIHKLLESEKK